MGFDITSPDFIDSWPTQLSEEDILQLGQSLRRISGDLMKASEGPMGERIWYQGREPYFDLVVENDQQGVRWFQLTLRGKVLLWNRTSQKVQTGETEELDVPPMLSYYAASKAIRDGAQLDMDFVRLGKRILRTRNGDPLLVSLADILETA